MNAMRIAYANGIKNAWPKYRTAVTRQAEINGAR
jgi:hypothetical protein